MLRTLFLSIVLTLPVNAEEPKVEVVKFLNPFGMKKDQAGPFASPDSKTGQPVNVNIRVDKVVDKNSILASVMLNIPKNPQVIISGIDTAELAEGKTFPSGNYRVTGSERLDNKTVWKVEVWSAKK